MRHTLPYAANCSLLFSELPLLARPAAAAAAGFDAIELGWPWPATGTPAAAEVDALVRAVTDAGVRLVALNLFGGRMDATECGLLALPGREAELADHLPLMAGLASRLGIACCHAPYGLVDPGRARSQHETAVANLRRVVEVLGPVGTTVLLEPMSGRDRYPLRTLADAAGVLRRVDRPGTGVLADLYHLARNGVDLGTADAADLHLVRHVQIADDPGRGEPGTGRLDLDGDLRRLQAGGYAGYVALEYVPTTTTEQSLAWLPVERRRGPG